MCLSHKSNNSGGVGILFAKDFIPISVDIEEIIKGRLLKINACFENVKLIFINVYAPTVGTERVIFLNILDNVIRNCSEDCNMILGGISTVLLQMSIGIIWNLMVPAENV